MIYESLCQASILGVPVSLKMLLPTLCCLSFCVIVELTLSFLEKSVTRNWWFLFGILTTQVVNVVWKEWTSGTNIAEYIKMGEGVTQMVLGVLAFITVVTIVLITMTISGVKHCISEEAFSGRLSFIIRVSQVVPLFILTVKLYIYGNGLVGDDGLIHELWSWFIGK